MGLAMSLAAGWFFWSAIRSPKRVVADRNARATGFWRWWHILVILAVIILVQVLEWYQDHEYRMRYQAPPVMQSGGASR
jgi:hypothetical protein